MKTENMNTKWNIISLSLRLGCARKQYPECFGEENFGLMTTQA